MKRQETPQRERFGDPSLRAMKAESSDDSESNGGSKVVKAVVHTDDVGARWGIGGNIARDLHALPKTSLPMP